MAEQDVITPNYLREALDYDPETGILKWKVRPLHHFKNSIAQKRWNSKYPGKVTGCPDPDGYLRVNIHGTPYLAHQLAWAIYYGEFEPIIDHKNRKSNDNRICNLRKATTSDNQHNRSMCRTNTSGYKGVSWCKSSHKWRATIFVNWKQKHLGVFETKETAYAAYCAAAKELHGDFACF